MHKIIIIILKLMTTARAVSMHAVVLFISTNVP